jgi:acetylornithine deacetylase/succinyl-diaminopimelate desuccinylase-like protein
MNPRLLEWCKRLIATPSVTGDGTRQIAELCAAELLGPAGIQARLIPSIREGANQVNLLAVVQGREPAASPLVLNTHLDTVPPGDRAQWTACGGDPFAPILIEDRIHGLGAADTKLDFAAKATALIECGTPRRTVYLAATFGEEHGLVGAKEMVEAGLLPAGALAFVGEPSQLKLITAHKGLSVFELEVSFQPSRLDGSKPAQRSIFIGRAAHSSTPALGLNAIRVALEAAAARPELKIIALRGGDAVNKVAARCEVLSAGDSAHPLRGSAESEIGDSSQNQFIPASAIGTTARFVEALYGFANSAGPPEDDFAAPTLTCNVGVIDTAPGRIRLEFELRSPPSLALQELRNRVQTLAGDVARGAPDVGLTLRERRANPGFRCALDSETVECGMAALARAGLPLETGVKAGCTEAGVYAAAGLRPVVIGPGPSVGVIHAPNEYNLLTEVEAAVRFYSALLET